MLAIGRTQASLRFFGDLVSVWRWPLRRWMRDLAADLKQGFRLMRRGPVFTVTAVIVLSLGIGVNTALVQHLRRRHAMRRPRRAAGPRTTRIRDAVSIAARPAEVADRAVPGHWEGDLLRGAHYSHIATLVERDSRFVMRLRIPRSDATTIARVLARRVRTLPPMLRHSLTWDRGTEMAAHRAFTIATDVQVYFCDPRSPWQRGSNENTNGLLRQYFPAGTDFTHVSQAALNRIATKLNTRPRKTLNYDTPAVRLAAAVATTA